MAKNVSTDVISKVQISGVGLPFTFGDWLKRRRQALRMTQSDLAASVSCTVSALRKIESGERRPSKQLAGLLARPLEISSENQATFIRVARGEMPVERLSSPVDLPPIDLQPAGELNRVRGNPPRVLSPFIGRETELTAIGQLLRDPGCALLTLIGPGGVGKTRLALQVGSDLIEVFSDGVYFVSLASIDRPTLLPAVIGAALQIPLSAKADPKQQLLDALAKKEMLLILDNLEHLQGGKSLLVDLLTRAPRLTILATSRERLRLEGEWIFPVEGLPTRKPGIPLRNGGSASSDLFVQNAKRLQPEFNPESGQQETIEQICWLLEGLPLAIELAASWVHVLPCLEIAREIQKNIDFLTEVKDDESTRHASMRVVFNHSWNLLTPVEQSVFRKLSVFHGSFEREAAEKVAAANLTHIRSLLDKSLLRRIGGDRYDMHELTRQFAYEQLVKTGEENSARDQMLMYYLSLAESAAPELQGERGPAWMRRLEEEMENLRAVFEWALASRQVELGMRLAWALYRFWYWHFHFTREARHWLEALLSAAKDMPDLPIQRMANLLYEMGAIATMQVDLPVAEAWLTRSFELYQSIGDKLGQASVLNSLGTIAIESQNFIKAKTLYQESLAFQSESGVKSAVQLHNLGTLSYFQGDFVTAKDYFEECLQFERENQNLGRIATNLCSLAATELQLGNRQVATAHYIESLQLRLKVDDTAGIAYALEGLASCYVDGEPIQRNAYLAARLLGAADKLRKEIGAPLSPVETGSSQRPSNLARILLGDADFQTAFHEGETSSIDELVLEIFRL